MRAALLTVALLGCGSRRPDVSAETAGDRPARTIRLVVEGPEGGPQMAIAIRDGDGPWQQLDAAGDLSFPITAQRYAVAAACPSRPGMVAVHYATVDADPVRITSCGEPEFATVRGTVRSAQGAVMVSSKFFPIAARADGSYEAASSPGTRDVIVLDGEGDRRAWSTRRIKVVRGIELAAATTTDLDVDLATDSIDLDHVEMPIDGLGEDETGELSVLLRSANGAIARLTLDRTPPFVADLPPAGALVRGDELSLSASADGADRTRPAVRKGDRWVLGAELGVVEATVVDGAPPRVLLSWPRYPGATSYVATVVQLQSCAMGKGCDVVSWMGSVSAEYAGDSDWVSFETPEFDWPEMGELSLQAGDEIRWYVRASLPGPDDRSSLGAGRDGTIAP